MNQQLNILKIETSSDSGVGNRIKFWECVSVDVLVPGNTFSVYGRELTVISIDEEEMVFSYRDRTFKINRHWQVLGTPEFDTSNERIPKQARNVFFFSKDKEEVCEWTVDHAGDLVSRMNENNDEGMLWKNIPLMRELIHEFKDVAPFRSENINPVYKAHYIACCIENGYIDKRETPRLFHSLCELYRLYRDFESSEDYDDYLRENMDKYYFREVDRWIYKFSMIVSDPEWEYAIQCWNGLGGMLKVDPIQATSKWEEVIYEVEKEVDEQLKDEPRGMSFCFGYWSAKRVALARRGIEWRSPSAMNPRVMFD